MSCVYCNIWFLDATRTYKYWMAHILYKNCLLQHIIEGELERRIEVTGRQGRRHKQLLDDLYEMRLYQKLKEEALDRTV